MFNRPALADLVARIRTDVLSRLSTDDILRRADAEVYARVLAGVANGLYGYLDWISDQVIYDTAESAMLERWANIWGITRIAAAAATGTCVFTGSVGAFMPAGTVAQALDGVQYQTLADVTFSSTTATANMAAVVPAQASNRATGQTLTLISPVVGVQSGGVAGAFVGGADVETDVALRARLLARIQNPPQGGASADYVAWALQVAGVTRAWCYPGELGLGTVTVRFMRDNDAGGAIPDAGEVAAVQSWINTLRPVTAQVAVVAPVAVPLNFTISGLVPASSTVQAAVQAQLQDLITREATPGGTLLLSHIRAAISAATGEADHVLTSPSANVVNTTGNITTMGVITWA